MSRGGLVFGGDALRENPCIRVGFIAIGVRMEAPFRSPVLPDWLLARRRRHNGRYLCKPQGHSMRFLKQIRRGNAKNRARRRDTPGRVLPTKSASTSLCAFVDGAPSMLNVL